MATQSRGAPYPLGSAANNTAADIQALSLWVNDRPGVATLTTTQRNALTGADIWDGRVIVNTTTDRIQRFDSGIGGWWDVAELGDIAALLATTGTPADLGLAASRGVSASAARADHIHAAPAWQSYTPTFNYSVGAGSLAGRYVVIGKTCHFWAKATLGAGFTFGAAPALGLPFTSRTQANLDLLGEANFLDSGSTNYRGVSIVLSADVDAGVWIQGTNGQFATVNAAAPFTWAVNDAITVNMTYEIA